MRKPTPTELGYLDVSTIPGVVVDLRYASTNNFTGKNVYGDFRTAYLHEIAHAKLFKAAERLSELKPGFTLVVFDTLRPAWAQEILFSHVAGTPQEPYIANPKEGSVHSYGFAVDLSILDDRNMELDMGTGFDDFSELSEPQLEEKFEKEGRLSSAHLANRGLLREVMTYAGFIQAPNEWWHFDALALHEIKGRYPRYEG